jgi:hypothetical protein
MEPKCRMLVYKTNNIGDAVQAVAVSRLLPQAVGVRRDGPEFDQRPDLPAVVQGFLYRPLRDRLGDNCLFAGIYLFSETPPAHFVPWLKASPWPVGVRDPWTLQRLREAGVHNTELVGCPTVTLPRYEGTRTGHLCVDADGPGDRITHLGHHKLTARQQWELASQLLEKYRKAELVTTDRLHVTLPCLAFGTPVRFVRKQIFDPGRLAILDHLGLKENDPSPVDMTGIAATYTAFIERHLGPGHMTDEPKMPVLKGDPDAGG